MNDFYISVSYLTAPEVACIGQELRSDPSDTQPGFYLRVYKDEGYTDIVKYTRLPLESLGALGVALDDALPDGGARIESALRAAVTQHRNEAKRRREAAEEALRKAQATLAALDAEEARTGDVTCQCWNEGQYARAHREDCPLHKD